MELVLNTKLQLSREDKWIWGLSRNGIYDTKSGYKLTELLRDLQNPPVPQQPSLESQLWTNLWKIKAPPKLKHFLWRVNSGALAVKTQLQTRGIQLNPTCSVCGQGVESICHVLFHCETAKEVWNLSNVPPPPAGWSQNSVFLNLHYLLKCSKNKTMGVASRQSFPWILWQLWKARNAFCYENVSPEPMVVIRRAMEEAAIWLNLHNAFPKPDPPELVREVGLEKWKKPPVSFLKCNVGSSWDGSSFTGGGVWLLRDEKGSVLYHSRRSFSGISSLRQAKLVAIQWAAEAMRDLKLKNVILESSDLEVKNAMEHPLLYMGR